MTNLTETQYLDAFHQFSRELIREYSLDTVLLQVAETAKIITDAEFAVLGLAEEPSGFEWFVFDGSATGGGQHSNHPPAGVEVVNKIRDQKTAIRLDDLHEAGLEPNFLSVHPDMRAFMGVPLLLQGEEIGQILLAGKKNASSFTDSDQIRIETLAAFAAAAIENARSYIRIRTNEHELAQRNQELAIFNDVTVAASTTLELEGILSTTLDRMMLHFNARCGEIFLKDEETGVFQLEIRKGEAPFPFWLEDAFRLGEGYLGKVVSSRDLLTEVDPRSEQLFSQDAFQKDKLRMLIAIPLVSKSRVLGVMSLAMRDPQDISERRRVLLQAVGLSVGTGLENGLLHRKAQRLAVLEERERIGMDLHDGIIQSIYAVGLMLEEGLLILNEKPAAMQGKLQQAIDNLNDVIRDIRAYILDLRPRRLAFENIATGLSNLAREFRVNSLANIDVDLPTEVAESCPPGIANIIFHITQEALANAARHAKATRVTVALARIENSIRLQIEDNGCGFDPKEMAASRGHGLENMEERAEAIGGEMHIRSSPGRGTSIIVSIPLAT